MRWMRPEIGGAFVTLALLVAGCGDGTVRPPPGSMLFDDDDTLSLECGDSFSEDIQPIMWQQCLQCHRANAASGGLALEDYDDMMAGGTSGPTVECGSCDTSLLYLRVTGLAQPIMPPTGYVALSAEEADCICAWIEAGCPGD